MLFGEIVEPSTRALVLDDDLELPEYKEPVFEWEGEPLPPDDIENLIFAESPKVFQICCKIIKGVNPVAKLTNEGLSIYKFKQNYLVLFDGNCKHLVIGEIVELLSPWFEKAKNIHGITSTLITTFHPLESLDLNNSSLTTFTKCLTNHEKVPFNFCDRLKTPNAIKGLGASALTYCIHSERKATLWIVYTDNMPIDSLNSAEIVRLFKTLGLEIKPDFRMSTLSSNLYM